MNDYPIHIPKQLHRIESNEFDASQWEFRNGIEKDSAITPGLNNQVIELNNKIEKFQKLDSSGAMLTIMNPDDKAGLEAALRLKDQFGAEVTVVTMGLPKAEDVLREALAMGADKAILVTDRVLGGADTWATSTTIAGAIRNLEYDLIITGRQAIDGDTAQVGPQVAEKMGWPQITYAEEVVDVNESQITVRRRLERGIEVVSSPLPVLITVTATAAPCRPRLAKKLLKN